MSIYKPKVDYRKIYRDHCGPIPRDKDGRSYEIHHIDGNSSNNDITNLKCVSIQEHYEIHKSQGDHAACLIMSDRMKISVEEKTCLAKLANTGENNPMYGTIWITNGVDNKKIRDTVIPKGWRQGRSFSEEHSKTFTKRSKAGSNNSRYNATLYKFKHLETGKEVTMTKYNFSKTYNIHGKHIRDLMRKTRESFRGWVFIPS